MEIDNFVIYSIKKLQEKCAKEGVTKSGFKKILKGDLNKFKCEKNKDVTTFLKDKAMLFSKKYKGETYLFYDIDLQNILGFFTITTKACKVNSIKSEDLIEKIDNYHSSKKRKEELIPVILIGQLAKNDIENNCLNLNIILNEAFCVIKEILSKTGGVGFVLIDVVKTKEQSYKKLVEKYKENGFSEARENTDTDGTTYIQMLKEIDFSSQEE